MTIRDRPSAQNIELFAGNGTLTADELWADTESRWMQPTAALSCHNSLPESADQYHVRKATNWGTVIMNGTPLVHRWTNSERHCTIRCNRAEHVPHDLQARVSASGQISLLSQIASTNADTPV